MTPNVYEEDEAQAMRVVVGEDQALMREGIVRLLEEAGFDVVGQAGDAVDLRRKVGAHRPDVAVVDIRMPPTNTDDGFQAAMTIREQHPRTGVLLLSQYVDERYAADLIGGDAEGVGYLLKERIGDLDAFADAVRRVGEGGSVLDPEVVVRILDRKRRDDPLESLSPREREVLELIAEGRSNHAIAERLVVSRSAIEKHVTQIFEKLGVQRDGTAHARVLAVLAYLRSR
jgi:DNA-binding NarL/FixJ family response regulator